MAECIALALYPAIDGDLAEMSSDLPVIARNGAHLCHLGGPKRSPSDFDPTTGCPTTPVEQKHQYAQDDALCFLVQVSPDTASR